MTRLVIQIPCYNEETALPVTLSELPRELPGVDRVEWLIVDDGSTDRTVEVARAHGVDHVVRLTRHQGLARAFMAGIEGSLRAGADLIVNTDADNQYRAADIPKLIEPILAGRAEIVVGARRTQHIQHFSRTKRMLQRFGSWVTRLASHTDIPDAPSGFRAMSREAALRLNVFNKYTYTVETIIQAGRLGMTITSVPIHTNRDLRPSRLIASVPAYVRRSVLIILRIFMMYKPLRFFFLLGSVPFSVGFLLGVRWLYYFFEGTSRTRIPSLILAATLILIGVQLWVVGLVADLLDVNRRLLEDVQLRLRRSELGPGLGGAAAARAEDSIPAGASGGRPVAAGAPRGAAVAAGRPGELAASGGQAVPAGAPGEKGVSATAPHDGSPAAAREPHAERTEVIFELAHGASEPGFPSRRSAPGHPSSRPAGERDA